MDPFISAYNAQVKVSHTAVVRELHEVLHRVMLEATNALYVGRYYLTESPDVKPTWPNPVGILPVRCSVAPVGQLMGLRSRRREGRTRGYLGPPAPG
jgi:hypothetical protein